MIADEPTTALDVTIQAQVLELLGRLTTETGTSLILITHDLGVVAGMTDRINVMYAGFVVETATTGDLFDRPSHPYTVGLLHSMPRVDDARGRAADPDRGPAARHAQRRPPAARSRRAARGGSTAAGPTTRRCAPVTEGVTLVTTGPAATHLVACHNPPTPEEADAGRPTREGWRPAPRARGRARRARHPRRDRRRGRDSRDGVAHDRSSRCSRSRTSRCGSGSRRG